MSEARTERLSMHGQAFQEMHGWPWDSELLELTKALLARGQNAAAAARSAFEPEPSLGPVSEEELESLLASGREVKGIATEREITNAIPFNTKNVERIIRDRGLARLRRQVDVQISRRIGELFAAGEDPTLAPTGQYWYPPGGYMGWHTNSRYPGWRIYLTHSTGPGRSFFRYRDPESGDVITSEDAEWSLRLFRVAVEAPLWHCVRADADRFSFGYLARPATAKTRAVRLARRGIATLERPLGGRRP